VAISRRSKIDRPRIMISSHTMRSSTVKASNMTAAKTGNETASATGQKRQYRHFRVISASAQ
jgi:hypothetical protein